MIRPIVVLLGEDRADGSDDRVAVGGDVDDVSAAADFPVQPLDRVAGPALPPELLREAGEGGDVGAGGVEVLGNLRGLCSRASRTRSNWAWTSSGPGWS